jgi:hypothetical protein
VEVNVSMPGAMNNSELIVFLVINKPTLLYNNVSILKSTNFSLELSLPSFNIF